VNSPPSERPKGISAGLAVSLLQYHLAAGHSNTATQYIVGHHGSDAVKSAVLQELNRVVPGAYRIAPTNPGLLVPLPSVQAESRAENRRAVDVS